MSDQPEKRDETTTFDTPTKLLGEFIQIFKKPNRKSKQDVKIDVVYFIMPNAQTVDVPINTYLIMGRNTPDKQQVNFDLSILYGPESGVSRVHAIAQIAQDAMIIRDYNSRNGTFLNGEELYPMRDYTVNDGDELRLGQVKMRVIFG